MMWAGAWQGRILRAHISYSAQDGGSMLERLGMVKLIRFEREEIYTDDVSAHGAHWRFVHVSSWWSIGARFKVSELSIERKANNSSNLGSSKTSVLALSVHRTRQSPINGNPRRIISLIGRARALSLLLCYMTYALYSCTRPYKRERAHLPSFCCDRYKNKRLGRRQLSWGKA